MTTSVRPILVTGATGRIGGIGRHVAAELVKRGLPVKALIRRLDERSEALQAMGIHRRHACKTRNARMDIPWIRPQLSVATNCRARTGVG